jgi:hypothetical protein
MKEVALSPKKIENMSNCATELLEVKYGKSIWY